LSSTLLIDACLRDAQKIAKEGAICGRYCDQVTPCLSSALDRFEGFFFFLLLAGSDRPYVRGEAEGTSYRKGDASVRSLGSAAP
jgi:hypothetical protein